MVGEGWDHATLMRMRLSDFRFEFSLQMELLEIRNKAIEDTRE